MIVSKVEERAEFIYDKTVYFISDYFISFYLDLVMSRRFCVNICVKVNIKQT